MTVYWLLFVMSAYAALTHVRGQDGGVITANNIGSANWVWRATWFMLTLLIGYRYEVGGDWGNYAMQYQVMLRQPLSELLQSGDPLHGLTNWIVGYFDLGVYGTNLIYGAIFSVGLIAFCRRQPNPALSMLVAVPYLIIVVAMGYSRQGVAIGLAMLALLELTERNNIKFVGYLFLAAAFHKSAVVLIPIAILTSTQQRIWTGIWVGVTGLLMYNLYLQDSVTSLYENYVEAAYGSEGGLIRISMNAVPAALFLLLRGRFGLEQHEQSLWTWIALIALGMVVAYYVSPSSTAVDRIGLYFIPIQMFVLSRLPDALGGDRHHGLVTGLVVLYLGTVEFVWLNYAVHAQWWLPYRFYPFV